MVNLYKKNKKIAGIFAATVLFIATTNIALAAGGWAHLTWNPVGSSNLGGYNMYYAIDTRPSGTCPTGGYTKVDAGNPSSPATTGYYIDNLTPGHTYYFALTAYNSDPGKYESGCATLAPSALDSKFINYSADFDGDHYVNGADFKILRDNYFQNGRNVSTGDTDHDGYVGGADFTALCGDYFKPML